MISIRTIEQGIYNWVTYITNETTIWLDQNAPRPPRPYIGLDVGASEAIGHDYHTEPDSNGDAVLYGNRELTVEIQYYGNEGFDTLEKLKTSVGQYDVKDIFIEHGIFYVDRLGEISDTTLLDTLWESRRILELRFRTSNQGVTDPHKYNVGCIETADVDGSYTK